MANVLVTGAAGYIGSHMCLELLEAGHDVIALDNLTNSSKISLQRVEKLAGKELNFIRADLRDAQDLYDIIATHKPEHTIHFAGLKAVGESCEQPVRYYLNNVGGTANLLEALEASGCRNIVFSSSSTVYGDVDSDHLPITEDAPLSANSPYGQTKLAIEYMLHDLSTADDRWNVSILRYFNPVGAHPSGEIGEDPLGIPLNLMPYITQVAVGKRDHLNVWGDDYDTPDGTCIRDYIHVVDLVKGHLKAMGRLEESPGLMIHNLGTGQGASVLEVVAAFESATGIDIGQKVEARRPGDVTAVYSDPARAASELGWRAERSLQDMCRDAWNWQEKNPEGYR